MNAHLPEQMVEVTIKDMLIGESAYAVPWAVMVDSSGAVWIRGGYSFHSKKEGTVQMSIERHANGFVVKVPRGYRGYQPQAISAEIKANLLPVIEIS